MDALGGGGVGNPETGEAQSPHLRFEIINNHRYPTRKGKGWNASAYVVSFR